MPPQGIIARLAGLLSPAEADSAKSWLHHHEAGAAAALGRRSTVPVEEDEEEEEEQEQQQGQQQEGQQEEGGKGEQSYFDDQGGRVMRGSSFSTSLDTVARPLAQHKRGLSFMTDLGTGPLSLAEFVELLPAVLERCTTRHMKKCEPVKRLLERLALPKAEWERFAFWDPDKLYTRNLVATDNKTFTLLLLCWNPGKESPIHDHPCEGCWVKSLQGTVQEVVYQMDPVEGLVAEATNYFHPGELSYIEDSLGFHKVGNPDARLGAVTLHCYIPPPKMARVWLASKGTRPEDSMTVPTCLYSAFGKRVLAPENEAQQQPQGSIMAPVPVPVPQAVVAPVVGGAGEVAGSPNNGRGGCCVEGPEKMAA